MGIHVSPDMMTWETLHLREFFPHKSIPQSNYEKNIRQIQIAGQFRGYLACFPQDCQGYEKQRKTEKLPQTRGDWGEMTIKAMWYPGLNLRTERGHQWKNDQIQISWGT